MSLKIYHNPRCSKSRATLQLLQQEGVEPEIVAYLEQPPSAEELKQVIERLGIRPPELIRFGESVAKELGIGPGDQRSVDEWVALMVANPILIERPIVVSEDGAAIGRPPESVLRLLE